MLFVCWVRAERVLGLSVLLGVAVFAVSAPVEVIWPSQQLTQQCLELFKFYLEQQPQQPKVIMLTHFTLLYPTRKGRVHSIHRISFQLRSKLIHCNNMYVLCGVYNCIDALHGVSPHVILRSLGPEDGAPITVLIIYCGQFTASICLKRVPPHPQ